MALWGFLLPLIITEQAVSCCADGLVWPCRSTGVGPTNFTTSLHFAKTAHGRIAVDDQLRVLVHSTQPEQHGPTTPSQVCAGLLASKAPASLAGAPLDDRHACHLMHWNSSLQTCCRAVLSRVTVQSALPEARTSVPVEPSVTQGSTALGLCRQWSHLCVG